MFEFVASIFALGLFAQVVFWTVAVVLFPVFWVWMLVDAALRPEDQFTRAGIEEKILWIVAMVFFHIIAVVYFIVVFRAVERRPYQAAVSTPAPPAPPSAPPAPAV